jgi:hypothetical protein
MVGSFLTYNDTINHGTTFNKINLILFDFYNMLVCPMQKIESRELVFSLLRRQQLQDYWQYDFSIKINNLSLFYRYFTQQYNLLYIKQ